MPHLPVTVQTTVFDVELPGKAVVLRSVEVALEGLLTHRCLGPSPKDLRNSGVKSLT